MTTNSVAGLRLGTRLFIAQAVALIASVLTAALVAAIIGPPLFHAHLVASGQDWGEPALAHVEEAFASSSAVSLGMGLLVALALALAVTWYITRRIRAGDGSSEDSGERRGNHATDDAQPESGLRKHVLIRRPSAHPAGCPDARR